MASGAGGGDDGGGGGGLGGWPRVLLSGEITASTDFTALLVTLPYHCALDLAGVARIDSGGRRAWINFIQALMNAGKQCVLDRCSVAMVTMLCSDVGERCIGGNRILSVFAPYYCPGCDKEETRLITVNGAEMEQLTALAPCPYCGKPVEFDDLPEAYLTFLKYI